MHDYELNKYIDIMFTKGIMCKRVEGTIQKEGALADQRVNRLCCGARCVNISTKIFHRINL